MPWRPNPVDNPIDRSLPADELADRLLDDGWGALDDRLSIIEAKAGSLMPTEVTLALAQSETPRDRLDASIKMISDVYKLTPESVFFPPAGLDRPVTYGDYLTDPATGQTVSFADAQRMVQPYSEDFWRSLLEGYKADVKANPSRGVRGRTRVPKVRGIVNQLLALGRLDETKDMAATDVFAMALTAAKQGIDPDLFARNLEWVNSNLPGTPGDAKVSVAMGATRNAVPLSHQAQAMYLLGDAGLRKEMDDELGQIEFSSTNTNLRDEDTLTKIARLSYVSAGVSLSPGYADVLTEPKNVETFDQQMQELITQATDLGIGGELKRASTNLIESDSANWLTRWSAEVLGRTLQGVEATGKYVIVPILGGINAGSVLLFEGLEGVKIPGLSEEMSQKIQGAINPTSAAWDLIKTVRYEGLGGEASGLEAPQMVYGLDEAMTLLKDAYAGRTYTGKLIQEQTYSPEWTAPLYELAWGYFLAPDSIATFALRRARAGRVLAVGGNLQVGGMFWNNAVDLVSQPQLRFASTSSPAGRSLTTYLVDSASNGSREMYLSSLRRLKATYGGVGLDKTMAWQIYRYVSDNRAAGTIRETIEANVERVLLSGFGIKLDPSSIPGTLAARIDIDAAERADMAARVAAHYDAEIAGVAERELPVSLAPPGVDERSFMASQVATDDAEVVERMEALLDGGYIADPVQAGWRQATPVNVGDRVRLADESGFLEGTVVEAGPLSGGAQELLLDSGQRIRTTDGALDIVDGVPVNVTEDAISRASRGTIRADEGALALAERQNMIDDVLAEGGQQRFVTITPAGGKVTSAPIEVIPDEFTGTFKVRAPGKARAGTTRYTAAEIVERWGVPERVFDWQAGRSFMPDLDDTLRAEFATGNLAFDPQRGLTLSAAAGMDPKVLESYRALTDDIAATARGVRTENAPVDVLDSNGSLLGVGDMVGYRAPDGTYTYGRVRGTASGPDGAMVKVTDSFTGQTHSVDAASSGLMEKGRSFDDALTDIRYQTALRRANTYAGAQQGEIARLNRLRQISLRQVELLPMRQLRGPDPLLEALDPLDAYLASHLAIQYELPRISVPFGVRSARQQLDRFLGNNGFYKRLSALGGTISEGSMGSLRIAIPDRAQTIEDTEVFLRRSRVFSPAEMADWSKKLSRAYLDPRADHKVAKTLEAIQDEMVRRIAASKGWSPDQVEKVLSVAGALAPRRLYDVHDIRVGALTGDDLKRAKAAIRNGTNQILDSELSPVFRSQLINAVDLVDPAYVRRGISEIGGLTRQIHRVLTKPLRALRTTPIAKRPVEQAVADMVTMARERGLGDAKELAVWAKKTRAKDYDAALRSFSSEFSKTRAADLDAALKANAPTFVPGPQTSRMLEAQGAGMRTLPAVSRKTFDLIYRDMFLRVWKPLVVIRPAYITRVVFGEEMARSLSTIGLINRMDAGRHSYKMLSGASWLGNKIIPGFRGADSATLELRIWDDVANEWMDTGRLLPNRPGQRVGTEAGVVEIPDEALIRSGATKLAIPTTDTAITTAYRKATGNWIPLTQSDRMFWESWANDLGNQIARDEAGIRILEGIRDGVSREGIDDALRAWYRGEKGMAYLRSMPAISDDQLLDPALLDELIDTEVEKQVSMAIRYTSGNPELASAALADQLDPNVLRNAYKDSAPLYVHGPEVKGTFGHDGLIDRFVSHAASAVLEWPTDKLSRQPFFRSWYDAMLRQQHTFYEAQQIKVTPDLLRGMEADARTFAIDQVRRVMFDFTRQNRLTDLANFVIPFFQPFAEAFTTWGRIIRQNPHLISALPRYYQALKRMGAIYDDPDTGEDSFKVGGLANAALGFQLEKAMGLPGMEFHSPVSAVNLLIQSTFPVPIGGESFEVPFPSFAPPMQWVLQRAFEHADLPPGLRARLAPWVMGYGAVDNVTDFLPAWMRHAYDFVFAKDDSQVIASSADKIAEVLYMQGLSPFVYRDEDGDGNAEVAPRPDPPEGMSQSEYQSLEPADKVSAWQDYVSQRSLDLARRLQGIRAWWSFVLPVSPRITYPTAELDRELQSLRGDMGYIEGTDEFLRRHEDQPELRLLTISESIWNPDPQSDSELISSPISIPANRFTDELLRLPYAREFAQDYPEWIWALIPTELRNVDEPESINSYFDQLNKGLREMRTPMMTQDDAEAALGWDAYFALRESWKVWQETTGKTVSQSSPTWEIAKAKIIDQPLAELREWNRSFDAEYANFELDGVDPNAMAHARAIVKNDYLVENIDAIAGLDAYLKLYDATQERMDQQRLTSLDQTAAAEVAADYQRGVEQILERHPDFRPAMDLFFDKALMGLPSHRELVYGDASPETIAKLEDYDQARESISDRIDAAMNDAERGDAFDDLRSLEDNTYQIFDDAENPLIVNYEDMTDPERTEFWASMLDQPYVYMSRFRREVVLGETISPEAEAVLGQYLEIYGQIQDLGQTDPEAELGPKFDALSAQMGAYAANDPVLADALMHANDWTYKGSKLIAEAADAGASAYPWWQNFLTSLHTAQLVVTSQDWHGAEPEYANVRDSLIAHVAKLRETSPDFKRSWDFYEELNGADLLIDAFMPEVYYPIGGNAYVPASRSDVAEAKPRTSGGWLYSDEDWDASWGLNG